MHVCEQFVKGGVASGRVFPSVFQSFLLGWKTVHWHKTHAPGDLNPESLHQKNMDLLEAILTLLGATVLVYYGGKFVLFSRMFFPKWCFPLSKTFFTSMGEWAGEKVFPTLWQVCLVYLNAITWINEQCGACESEYDHQSTVFEVTQDCEVGSKIFAVRGPLGLVYTFHFHAGRYLCNVERWDACPDSASTVFL